MADSGALSRRQDGGDRLSRLSGISTLNVTALLYDPSRRTVTVEYRVRSLFPVALSLEKLTPPGALAAAAPAQESRRPTVCVPDGGLNEGATQCFHSGALVLPLAGAGSCEIGGPWAFSFRTACVRSEDVEISRLSPPEALNFAQADCSGLPQSVLLSATAAAAGANPCAVPVTVPFISVTTEVDRQQYAFGDRPTIALRFSPSSGNPPIEEVRIISVSVAKIGPDASPRPTTAPYATELLGESPGGFSTPGFLRTLGRRSLLRITDMEDGPVTMVNVRPTMSTMLRGAWLEPWEMGGTSRFNVSVRARVRFFEAGSARARRLAARQAEGIELQVPQPELATTVEAWVMMSVAVPKGVYDPDSGTISDPPPPPAGLSAGAIAGIVIGSLIGAFCIALCAMYCWRRVERRRRAAQKDLARERVLGGVLPRLGGRKASSDPEGAYYPSYIENKSPYVKLLEEDEDDAATATGSPSALELDNMDPAAKRDSDSDGTARA
ncbi:hypothetical protein DFJ74DRAFT_689764 [Hyaloraphidium curvatum]|nr:hypothetical protein DFJ74DRAFT_689764 [Hyaloraphidium curvatum]